MASVARPAPSTATHADIHAHRVLILDFGAQYTQLIARRVRELGVYCEIHPWDITDAEVRAFQPRGVILSGGPESVTDANPPKAPGGSVRARGTRARHLLRHADDGAAARRPRRGLDGAGVRLCRSDRDRREPAARSSGGPPRQPRPAGSRCLDESRRSRRRPAGRLHCHRLHGLDSIRRDGGRASAVLRRAVPPRGDSYHSGCTAPRALRARDRRLRCALEHRQHHRGRDRAGPRPGRKRQGTVGPLGWR